MKVIIQDLPKKQWEELAQNSGIQERDIVIGEGMDWNWDKEIIGTCAKFIVISRCVYGGFSPFIQSIFEQSQGYIGTFLELRRGQTQFEVMNKNKDTFEMVCCFYGDFIRIKEEQLARLQAVSDGISLQAREVRIVFCSSINQIRQLEGVLR